MDFKDRIELIPEYLLKPELEDRIDSLPEEMLKCPEVVETEFESEKSSLCTRAL